MKKSTTTIMVFLFFLTIPLWGLNFSKLRAEKVDAVKKKIRINLETERLITIENNNPINAYQIAGKGDPQKSPTPTGSFTITEKRRKVLSNISNTWLPWSLRFYKGYFIHEVPIKPSGGRVKTNYSLGCIRLKPQDAEKVYRWAEIGTKVEIYKNNLVKTKREKYFLLYKNGLKKRVWFPNLFLMDQKATMIPGSELEAYRYLFPNLNKIKPAQKSFFPIKNSILVSFPRLF